MNLKTLFIGLLIVLLATTLLFPKTAEEKYCDQFSGESNVDEVSNDYLSCQTETRCKVEEESLTTKEINQDSIVFFCVPSNDIQE